MSAATLLASAMAGGDDGLSPRDCLICVAYEYAGGNSAQTQLAAAIESGFDRISDGDLKKCIASILNH
jgi:hypothetical protein